MLGFPPGTAESKENEAISFSDLELVVPLTSSDVKPLMYLKQIHSQFSVQCPLSLRFMSVFLFVSLRALFAHVFMNASQICEVQQPQSCQALEIVPRQKEVVHRVPDYTTEYH